MSPLLLFVIVTAGVAVGGVLSTVFLVFVQVTLEVVVGP